MASLIDKGIFMLQELMKNISEADMVLIAVGKETETLDLSGQDMFEKSAEFYRESFAELLQDIPEQTTSQQTKAFSKLDFYNRIEKLVKGKDYFVADLSVDGIIYKSELNRLRIVTPCGNFMKLQCACSDKLEDAAPYYEKDVCPVCDICHRKMVPNVYKTDGYNEEGYLKQWNLYNIWLQRSLSKKLFVLELGMDFSVPTVLRWPLERVVFISNTAKMYRVSEKYSQFPPEIANKVTSIPMNSMDYIGEL